MPSKAKYVQKVVGCNHVIVIPSIVVKRVLADQLGGQAFFVECSSYLVQHALRDVNAGDFCTSFGGHDRVFAAACAEEQNGLSRLDVIQLMLFARPDLIRRIELGTLFVKPSGAIVVLDRA